MNLGTNAGEAYVQLEINGDGMNEGIVDAVDGAGPGVEKAGERLGDRTGEGFDEGFFDRIHDRLTQHLEKDLDKNFKNMGRRLGRSLGTSLKNAMTEKMEEIEQSMGRLIDTVETKASGGGGKGGGGRGGGRGGLGNAGFSGGDDTPDYTGLRSFYAAFERARVKLHADANAAIQKQDDDANKAYLAIIKQQEKVYADAAKAHEKDVAAFSKMWNAAHAENIKRTQKDADAFTKIWAAAHAEDLKRMQKRAAEDEKILRSRKSIGDTVTNVLGGNSRVGPLRVLGKSIGGLTSLVEGVGKAAKPVIDGFTKGFSEAGEQVSRFQKLLSGLSGAGAAAGQQGAKAFEMLAASGPGALVAIAVVVVAMSALVSIAGALLGIITALISTIASGLVGALLVLGGALSAVVAAGGLLTAAFMSMDDAQKALLKDSFLPLKQEMIGLGQIMLRDLVPAFSVWSENLQRALALAEPVAAVMGKAFAEAGTSLTAAFSGPGFQAFSTALAVYLPSIVQRLSLALGSFLNGLTGLFAALMPFVDRFAGYLARVADEFSRWANSAAGQNAIVDFTTRALTSLESLWHFITQLGGLIADVLFSSPAQNAGNGIFDGMARSLEGLRAKISDGSLQKWFSDAIEFGGHLWSVMKALGEVIEALYDSGVLHAVGMAFEGMAKTIEILSYILDPFIGAISGDLPSALMLLLGPIGLVANSILKIGEAAEWAGNLLNKLLPGNPFGGGPTGKSSFLEGAAKVVENSVAKPFKVPALSSLLPGSAIGGLVSSGSNALANTTSSKTKAQYVNPYTAYANSLIKDGPSEISKIRQTLKALTKQVAAAVMEVAKSSDYMAARASLLTSANSLIDGGKTAVENARSALNSAAQSLASASSAGEAKKALADVRDAQAALSLALASQKRLDKQAKILKAQRNVTARNVSALLDGRIPHSATLADFAKAREKIASKIEAANQKLSDAISLRKDYKKAISDSIKAYGDITSAQAQSVNGVEQALTATDVTANLQDRLAKIKAFNDNLRILLAQGLSNAAYKQILDAGVDGGSGTAAALVAGGQGAVQQVNSLTAQIAAAANSLGSAASSQLYDAGVDAARGLVDGLMSLSDQLDSAADHLGKSIANAIRKSLGIKSPSTVLRGMMEHVGDGAVLGLDDQAHKVDVAAKRFSDRIAVSPEVAAYAARQGQPATVSGNTNDIDITVITPTEDPRAVAMEVLNEVTGRLT